MAFSLGDVALQEISTSVRIRRQAQGGTRKDIIIISLERCHHITGEDNEDTGVI